MPPNSSPSPRSRRPLTLPAHDLCHVLGGGHWYTLGGVAAALQAQLGLFVESAELGVAGPFGGGGGLGTRVNSLFSSNLLQFNIFTHLLLFTIPIYIPVFYCKEGFPYFI